MGIKVLRGDDRLLGIEDQVFLSEKMAERIFGKEDPIGKQLLYGKTILIRWPGYSVTYRKIVIYVLTLSLLSLI